MATKAYLDTCACVVEYGPKPLKALVRYHSKCPYHAAMSDADAYAEILTAHAQKARAIKAVRRALYGTDDLSDKTVFPPEDPRRATPWIAFDATAGRRNIVVDDTAFATSEKRAVERELAKVSGTHEVRLGTKTISRTG